MADFHVELTASTKTSQCSANAWGTLRHTITDDEADEFGFNDSSRILDACGAAIGKNPDRYFLHNPTTPHPNPGDHAYDNAYNVFGWDPVTVTLQSTAAEFLGIDSEPVIASHVQWDNEEDHSVNFSASLAVSKTETVSHSVTSGGKIGTGTKISAKVGIEGFGDITGEESFSFEIDWSNTDTQTTSIQVGVTASAQSDVPAHSTETAYLFSTLGSARFRITYQATLGGDLMTLNDDWYGGHCYRGLDPSWVLWKAGLPRSVTIQHEYNVGFYSGTLIDVAPGPYDPDHKPPSRSGLHPIFRADQLLRPNGHQPPN